MPVIQETFFIPDDIMTKILTGEYIRTGGIIRFATGPNKGRIVKHLDPIELKEIEKTKSIWGKVVQFAKTNKKPLIVGSIIVGAVAGTFLYVKFKKGEAEEVKTFRIQLKAYIDEIRIGKLQLTSIENLLTAINELKKLKLLSDIKIELSAEDLDILVNRIYSFTLQFAKINNYNICDGDLPRCNDSLEDLHNQLTIQKRIFEFAA